MAGSHNPAGVAFVAFVAATARPEAAHAAATHDLRRRSTPSVESERAALITETASATELRAPGAALNTGRNDG